MDKPLFNIRVYGILINELGRLLVTDELRFNIKMTKFPGGGLHYGEGTIDCLKRECREEFNSEIEITGHFYTTDFFQKSAFDDKQLISIYYKINLPDDSGLIISENKFNFGVEKEGSQAFRWIELNNKLKGEFTFPIDKLVAEMLIKEKKIKKLKN